MIYVKYVVFVLLYASWMYFHDPYFLSFPFGSIFVVIFALEFVFDFVLGRRRTSGEAEASVCLERESKVPGTKSAD
jgi:hypothetical protein